MLNGKILMATDFSDPASRLEKCLKELQEIGASEVVLVHVIDIRNSGMNTANIMKYNQQRLERIKENIKEMGFEVETKIPIGFAADEIVKLAEEEDVSLILIASRGEGVIKQLFLGSTAYDVIRKSTRPVLLEKIEEVDGEARVCCMRKFNKILVPTDFSKEAAKVIEMIKKMHTPTREIILVSIIESSNDLEELEQRKQEAQKKLEEIKKDLDREDISSRQSVRIGEGVASSNIIRIAKEEEAGIIIMPTTGRGSIKNIILGSTADRVARRSPIPVLLVPVDKNGK